MNEESIIVSAEEFRNKEKFTHREIVMGQVKKITTIYSQELTKGFMKYSQLSRFGTQEPITYIPDGRLSYIQSVECLYDLLQPKFDDKMIEKAKKIEEKAKEKHKELKEKFDEEENVSYDDWLVEKVQFKRNMFQELCLLLERLNWLGEESAEE